MQRLSMQKIKERLNEAAKDDPFKNTQKVNLKTSTGSKATEPSDKATKLKAGTKGMKGPKLKQFEIKTAKNSGPDKAPASGKMYDANNGSAKTKEVAAPKMSVKGSAKTPLANADGFSMDLSKLGIKWAKTREVSQTEKHDLEGSSVLSPKTQKIKFSVSMPKIDYGIMTTASAKMGPSSQSHKYHEVKNVKLVKEGLINGQVTIKLPNNVYNFDVMTTKELKSICENYAAIGQEIEVVFKPMVRKFYLRPEIKRALAEAVHYNMNNMKKSYAATLSEGKRAVKKALSESHSDFFSSDKNDFVVENFKQVMKQGYEFYRDLYESHLKPYDVTVTAYTISGRESFKIVTRALSEGHAAYNAFNEVLTETGIKTKLDKAWVGAKKFVYEDVKGILSKQLNFDIDTLDFKKAGPNKTTTTRLNPTVPKYSTLSVKNPKVDGATKYKIPKKKVCESVWELLSPNFKANGSCTKGPFPLRAGFPRAMSESFNMASTPLNEGMGSVTYESGREYIADYFQDEMEEIAERLNMKADWDWDHGNLEAGYSIWNRNVEFIVCLNGRSTDNGDVITKINVGWHDGRKAKGKSFPPTAYEQARKYLDTIVWDWFKTNGVLPSDFQGQEMPDHYRYNDIDDQTHGVENHSVGH